MYLNIGEINLCMTLFSCSPIHIFRQLISRQHIFRRLISRLRGKITLSLLDSGLMNRSLPLGVQGLGIPANLYHCFRWAPTIVSGEPPPLFLVRNLLQCMSMSSFLTWLSYLPRHMAIFQCPLSHLRRPYWWQPMFQPLLSDQGLSGSVCWVGSTGTRVYQYTFSPIKNFKKDKPPTLPGRRSLQDHDPTIMAGTFVGTGRDDIDGR